MGSRPYGAAIARSKGKPKTGTLRTEDLVQVEFHMRLFADAEIARFFGFVPALSVGFDLFSTTAAGGSLLTVAPVFGVRLRRTVF